jgi:hypothetical protein
MILLRWRVGPLVRETINNKAIFSNTVFASQIESDTVALCGTRVVLLDKRRSVGETIGTALQVRSEDGPPFSRRCELRAAAAHLSLVAKPATGTRAHAAITVKRVIQCVIMMITSRVPAIGIEGQSAGRGGGVAQDLACLLGLPSWREGADAPPHDLRSWCGSVQWPRHLSVEINDMAMFCLVS